MRLRGGGVGHLGTHYLDSRLKDNNHKLCDRQQEEARIAGMYDDSNSHLHKEWGDGIEDKSEMDEERTSQTEVNHSEEDEEDEDEHVIPSIRAAVDTFSSI